MATRNPYAKTVKFFQKVSDLYISRNGEEVFLSEGHMIVKMHVAAYDAFFRPVSGQFVNLENGEKAAKRGNMTMPEKSGTAPDLEKLFSGFRAEAKKPVSVSPFLMEYSKDGKKKEYQRMLTGIGYYVSIQETFYSIAEEIGFRSFTNKGNSISGVFAESGNNGIVILPIKADQQKIDSFVNVTK